MKLRFSGSARRPRFRLAWLSALLISTGAAAAAHDTDHDPCDHEHAAERPARGAIDHSVRGAGYADRAGIVSEGGVDAARRAHFLYDPSTAEQLDGRCEPIVAIAAGETLSDIAEYCDRPAGRILQANPEIISPRTIRAGQPIYIPDAEGERTTWSVRGEVVPLFGGSILEAAPLADYGRAREARIIAAGLQRHERVAIFAGEKRGAMRWVKMVEADRNGRVNEVVPLPHGDRFSDVQWAMQPEDGRVIYSAPYALGEAAYIDPLQ